jgi:hypothetical protein
MGLPGQIDSSSSRHRTQTAGFAWAINHQVSAMKAARRPDAPRRCGRLRPAGRRGGSWPGSGRRGGGNERPAARIGADAQHGGRDAASARCVVPGVRWDALVDGTAGPEGLAVPHVPSAGSSAARGDPKGRGGTGGAPSVRSRRRLAVPTGWARPGRGAMTRVAFNEGAELEKRVNGGELQPISEPVGSCNRGALYAHPRVVKS